MKGGGSLSSKLTKKQKAFADEYIINGGNATQAAIKAGYSKKTAGVIGKQNLTKLNIVDYITEKLNPIEKKREIDADDALNELISIWQGEVQISASKHIDNLAGGEVVKDMTYEFTPDLENKVKALDMYLKYKTLLSQTRAEEAKTRKAEAEAAIIENKASKLVLDEDKQSQVNDLIKIGRELLGDANAST